VHDCVCAKMKLAGYGVTGRRSGGSRSMIWVVGSWLLGRFARVGSLEAAGVRSLGSTHRIWNSLLRRAGRAHFFRRVSGRDGVA